MCSTKDVAGDIIGKLDITCGKFQNNAINNVKHT